MPENAPSTPVEPDGPAVRDPASPLRDADATALPPVAIGEAADDLVIQGHTYDGIREYDNPMPGWWVGIFWITVLFAPVYVLGVHVFDWIDSYEDDFAEAGAALEEVRAVYASTGPDFKTDPGALAEYAQDATMAVAGEANFAAICAACHGENGQGVIGPNLTDAYWIHGDDPVQLWASIDEGFPAKGMPPMNLQLSEQEMAEVMAYIVSIQGSNPADAKAPEGELTM